MVAAALQPQRLCTALLQSAACRPHGLVLCQQTALKCWGWLWGFALATSAHAPQRKWRTSKWSAENTLVPDVRPDLSS